MKTRPFFLFRRWSASPGLLVFASVAVAAAGSARAQEPVPSPTPALQIIQQQVVNVGTHRIVFNRVVPPPPQPTPTPAPAPVAAAFTPTTAPRSKARAATGSKRVARSVGTSTNDAEGGDTEPRPLFLSATVYDHGQFTELRGHDAVGPWHAWSNVDFLLLAPVTEFGAGATTTYALYLGLGSDTSDWLTATGQYPAAVSSLPAGQASYYFADGATAVMHPEAAAALDALHLYADANRPALLQARQQREADQVTQAAQAEDARQHPTPPPDTIINFWPKQNSVFLGH